MNKLKEEFPNVFLLGVSKVPNYEVHFYLKTYRKPVYLPPRSAPFAIKDKVDNGIDRLGKEGIISKRTNSLLTWGTPTLLIVKPNGDIIQSTDTG